MSSDTIRETEGPKSYSWQLDAHCTTASMGGMGTSKQSRNIADTR